jgi:predicted ATPase/DNA-binding SARP family transcriptional activator
MAQFRLYLFGPPRLERDGQPVEIQLRKAMALLAYLTMTRQTHSRDTLATLFWPEKNQQTARANLRRTLFDLSQLVAAQVLDATQETVGLHPATTIWLDAVTFQQDLAESLPPHSPVDSLIAANVTRLVEIADLYTDDFLAGFTLPDCPAFDDWQFFQREELRRSYATLLQQLTHTHETQGNLEEAARYARRWLQLDPLEEAVHRRLMALYAQAGQPAAALRQYEECVRLLAQELEVEPEEETTALYEAIRTRRFQQNQGVGNREWGVGGTTPHSLLPTPHSPLPTPHSPLPAQTTPFVGRDQELAEIVRRLCDPACRLLTLVGPGGIGKTRLAIEAARSLTEPAAQELPPNRESRPMVVEAPHSALRGALRAPHFADGVLFVPLQTVSEADGLVTGISEALGIRFLGEGSPRGQLLDSLRPKRLLVVLDSFEHLLADSDLVADILACSHGIKILITSREALDLQEAWFHPVAGMRFPKERVGDGGAFTDYDAVNLFVQRARHVQIGFSIETERTHVMRICRAVGGMPLALELAAAWLKVLPCAKIADELERSLDILTTRHQNIPARHRSMRAVLEQTWQHLTPAERSVLSKLSIFRGGCPQPAAEQVTGATLPLLTALVDRALLRLTADGRYETHELVRQFAEEQLHAAPQEEAEARSQHCAYYLSLLQRRTADLKGKRQVAAFAEISADLSNIRMAWQYAVDQRELAALENAAEALWLFSDSYGTFLEGETAFQLAVTSLTAQRPADHLPESQRNLVGFFLAGQGYLCQRRGDWKQARSLMEQGLSLLQQSQQPDQAKQAFACLYFGWLVSSRMEFELAKEMGRTSLALFTTLQDRWGMAASLEMLGGIAKREAAFDEAEQFYQEGLSLSTEIESHKLRGGFLANLADILLCRGDYALAHQYLSAAYEIAQQIGARPSLANVLRDLGRLAICQGRYSQAIQLVEESLAYAQEIGYQWAKRSILIVLGTAYYLQGNFAEAERRYQECLQAARANEYSTNTAYSLGGLGVLAFAQGNLQHAERLLREALSFWQQYGQVYEIASALRYLGHLYVAGEESRKPAARQHYVEALHLTLEQKLAPIALDVFVGAARLLDAAGKTQRALDLLDLATHHPASTYETQEQASRLRQKLAAASPTSGSTALPAQLPDWQVTARQLSDELLQLEWHTIEAIPTNLPPQPTPFIGRAHELAEIQRSLLTPACRLLTIVGPGGIGKSRLALAVAQSIVEWGVGSREHHSPLPTPHSPHFKDGIYFVPLQPVAVAGGVIAAVAEATGFRFYSDTPPQQQLTAFLREKQMLLVLDSMEHLPDGAALVTEILAKAPGVKLLVTSQKALNLREEWFHPLAGMTMPSGAVLYRQAAATQPEKGGGLTSDAAQLFVQSAMRARPDFVADAEQEQIARICRLVDGMPLALELAAAWLKVLPCRQIADEIERSLDILTARHQNIPARHRSMYVVLEQSWQLLGEDEQQVLKQLAVFRGGFTQDAALKVAGASLPTLASLVEKALVWVTQGGRYQMHELLRQYAQQQLVADPDEQGVIRTHHSTYYLRFLSTRAALLIGRARRVALEEINQEIENVRAAWLWAAQQGDLIALHEAVEPLYHFYQIQSRFQDGKDLFVQAWESLRPLSGGGERAAAAITPVRILARCGAFCHFLCEYDLAGRYLEEGLALAQKAGEQAEVAFVLNFLGQLTVWKGEQATAQRYLLESLAISQAIGDKSGAASALEKLANLTHATFGEYAESKRLAAQSLALSRELGRPDWIAYALDTLGFVTFCLGEYADAESYYRESLSLFEMIGDQYGTAMAQGGIALVLWAMPGGKQAEASDYLERSLLICRTIGHQGQVAGRLAGLARIANDQGDYEKAQQLAREGLTLAHEVGSPVYLSHILYSLGRAAYETGALRSAREHLVEALRLSAETGLLANLAIALFHYAALLIEESRQELAGGVEQPIEMKTTALGLLLLVQRHPATWHVYKERASALLTDLATQVPATALAMAQNHAENHPLEEVVAHLLDNEDRRVN